MKIVVRILEKVGYIVDLADNGQEAVNAVTIDHQLVLMDCSMPVMDGFEATEKILEMFPEMPVIALTAFARADIEKENRFSACGMYVS